MKNESIPSIELLESRQLLSGIADTGEKQVKDIPCSEIKESIKGTIETWALFGANAALCTAGNVLGSSIGNDKFRLTDRYIGTTIGSCILEGMVLTGLTGPQLDPVNGMIYNLGFNFLVGAARR